MGIGESSANSVGMVGAVHPTPRPARVKAIDAAEERNMRGRNVIIHELQIEGHEERW
jgi:hypothetical protein